MKKRTALFCSTIFLSIAMLLCVAYPNVADITKSESSHAVTAVVSNGDNVELKNNWVRVFYENGGANSTRTTMSEDDGTSYVTYNTAVVIDDSEYPLSSWTLSRSEQSGDWGKIRTWGDTRSEVWAYLRDTVTGAYGEAVVGTGENIYVARGTTFNRYKPADGSWTAMTAPPSETGGFKSGTALAWDNNYNIYAFFGGAGTDNRSWFYSYNISEDSWTQLENTPLTVAGRSQNAGDAITWVAPGVVDSENAYLFAFIGSSGWANHGDFIRYKISTNTWTTLTKPTWWVNGKPEDGSSLVWTGGDNLYAMQGDEPEATPNCLFYRYSISGNSWTQLDNIPELDGIGDGASLLWTGLYSGGEAGYIYAPSGGTSVETYNDNFYRFSIVDNSWEQLLDLPRTIGNYTGSRMGYAGSAIHFWQGMASGETGGGDDLFKLVQNDTTVAVDYNMYVNRWRLDVMPVYTVTTTTSHAIKVKLTLDEAFDNVASLKYWILIDPQTDGGGTWVVRFKENDVSIDAAAKTLTWNLGTYTGSNSFKFMFSLWEGWDSVGHDRWNWNENYYVETVVDSGLITRAKIGTVEVGSDGMPLIQMPGDNFWDLTISHTEHTLSAAPKTFTGAHTTYREFTTDARRRFRLRDNIELIEYQVTVAGSSADSLIWMLKTGENATNTTRKFLYYSGGVQETSTFNTYTVDTAYPVVYFVSSATENRAVAIVPVDSLTDSSIVFDIRGLLTSIPTQVGKYYLLMMEDVTSNQVWSKAVEWRDIVNSNKPVITSKLSIDTQVESDGISAYITTTENISIWVNLTSSSSQRKYYYLYFDSPSTKQFEIWTDTLRNVENVQRVHIERMTGANNEVVGIQLEVVPGSGFSVDLYVNTGARPHTVPVASTYIANCDENVSVTMSAYEVENQASSVTVSFIKGTFTQNVSASFVSRADNVSTWTATFDNHNAPVGTYQVKYSVSDALARSVASDSLGLSKDNLFLWENLRIILSIPSTIAEGSVENYSIVTEWQSSGVKIENSDVLVRVFDPESTQILHDFSGKTDASGQLKLQFMLDRVWLGQYEFRVTYAKKQTENSLFSRTASQKFTVSSTAKVKIITMTPKDDKLTILLWSRSSVSESLILTLSVHDKNVMRVVHKIIDETLTAGQSKTINILYDVTLQEGVYSYTLYVDSTLGMNYDARTVDTTLIVDIVLTPSLEWVPLKSAVLNGDNSFDLTLSRSYLVTNSTQVQKNNFFFRQAVPLEYGSSTRIWIENIPYDTIVDSDGLVSQMFNVPPRTTMTVNMEVTQSKALRLTWIKYGEIVARPRLEKQYDVTIRNTLDQVLKDVVITIPLNDIVMVKDKTTGRELEFWAGSSTNIKLPILSSSGSIQLEIYQFVSPTISSLLMSMFKSVFGLPAILWAAIAALILWVITRKKLGMKGQALILLMPFVILLGVALFGGLA